MSSSYQTHPRDRSRQRSVDRYPEPTLYQDPPSSPATGTKRLFSNRQSKLSYNSENHGENEETEASGAVHSEKRHRNSDWPLSSTSPSNSAGRPPLRKLNMPNSPNARRPSSQRRPSRFVEGSMNDRVSKKPPTTYLGSDEELQERYEQDQQANNRGKKPRPYTYSHPPTGSAPGETDVSRHSSIFRFGKSIASSFNPSNWKIWSKPQPEQEDEEAAQLRIMKERQEKAERIYKELKQSGHFRDSQTRHQSYDGSGESKLFNKHDSSLGLGDDGRDSRMSIDSRMSKEEKRRGRVFLEPPKMPGNHRGESPASNAGSTVPSSTSSPNKPSFHFKKPSLNNIKNTLTSEAQPSNARHSGEQQARRIPSRKDLQKQQKLVKRVSDLEGKLEAARRQLNEALGEPLPSQPPPKINRSRFVPGAMPTLPSERLLSGYIDSDTGFSDGELNEEIGKAVSIDQALGTALKPKVNADHSTMEPEKAAPTLVQAFKLVQSIERDDDEITRATTTPSDASTNLPASIDSDYKPAPEHEPEEEFDEVSDRDVTPKPRQLKPAAKKRKSKDSDNQAYKPISETGSEPLSPVKKVTPRKRAVAAPARKLQKTAAAQTGPPNYPPPPPPSKKHLPEVSTPRYERPAKVIKTASNSSPSALTEPRISSPKYNQETSSRNTSAVTGNRQPRANRSHKSRGRQSVSPPPSSSVTGLEYTKPSQAASNHIAFQLQEQVQSNERGEDDVPPMPKLPKAVRLPSGEVVPVNPNPPPPRAASATSRSSKGSKLTKARKESVRKGSAAAESDDTRKPGAMPKSQSKASFEWPDDVF